MRYAQKAADLGTSDDMRSSRVRTGLSGLMVLFGGSGGVDDDRKDEDCCCCCC